MTNNRLEEIRTRWRRTDLPDKLFTGHVQRDIAYLLSLLDTRPAVAADQTREDEAVAVVRYCENTATPFQQKVGYVMDALATPVAADARELVEQWRSCLPLKEVTEREWRDLERCITAYANQRDSEVREVLEGTSRVLKFKNGPDQRCWCNKNWTHTPACLAARALYEKLQPENPGR